MSLTAEQQDNFEDIEKQFAVKGAQCRSAIASSMLKLTVLDSCPAHDHLLVYSREGPWL